jgi:hypothetical protein
VVGEIVSGSKRFEMIRQCIKGQPRLVLNVYKKDEGLGWFGVEHAFDLG